MVLFIHFVGFKRFQYISNVKIFRKYLKYDCNMLIFEGNQKAD